MAKLARAQRAAAATLKRAIPTATVERNYTLLLNGMAVELPVTQLAKAAKLSFTHKLYPSYRYNLALNRSPGLMGADTLIAAGGGSGEGMKIAVVDDGVDPANRFFDPTGFSYPAGFPKGGKKWTSPKVIVARSFVGAGADERSGLALDPEASYHGTHVAGIAAGNAQTTAPAGTDHNQTTGLSGVAPRAQIGNYRVFNVPTPLGHVSNTPEIVAAFEAAVRDGMDVINFSGGGPQTDPAERRARRGGAERLCRRRRPRDLGRERPRRLRARHRRLARNRARRDLGRGAVEQPRLRSRPHRHGAGRARRR